MRGVFESLELTLVFCASLICLAMTGGFGALAATLIGLGLCVVIATKMTRQEQKEPPHPK